MGSPVKLYQKEMHNNLGFFATWVPGSILQPGDYGLLESGSFIRQGNLSEFGIANPETTEGVPQDMSYSASAERKVGLTAGVSTAVPIGKGEISIQFTRQGGYVFEALGVRQIDVSNRRLLGESILDLYKQGKWRKEWFVVDALYRAESATIIVSEDSSSEIVLNASADVPLGTLPLANPKASISVSSLSGKVMHVIAKSNLSPLYSCLKVDVWPFELMEPKIKSVRGIESIETTRVGEDEVGVTRPIIDSLLDS